MNIKKIALTGALALSVVTLVGTVAFAQSALPAKSLSINNSGEVHLAGTVSAVSGSTVSVSSWGGTWVVNAGTLSLADIQVGDTVKVEGTVSSGMNITAKNIKDTSVRAVKKVNGTIGALNTTAGTFTLATSTMGNVNVVTNSTTNVFLNGTTSVVANLSNGASATIAGSFNATTNTITASVITSPSIAAYDDDNDKNDRGNKWGWLKAMLGLRWNKK